MKKTITTIKTLATSIIVMMAATTMAQPTCTLDPVFIASPKYGIWPDSATNFASGQVGVAYAQNITIKVPLDTVQGPVKICFTRFELLAPTGYPNYNLPPGLTLTGNPSTLKFPANANSCAIISGTPTTAGTYTLHFQVDVYGNVTSPSSSCPTPVNPNSGNKITTENINYYIINISPASNVQEYQSIQHIAVFPQPAASEINITFNSLKNNVIHFKLSDIAGKIIINQTISAHVGENKVSINTSNIDNGIYIYSIESDNDFISNKLIIQK